MIFEFFKRLFWKADETTRKRKASDSLFPMEDSSHPKKHCHDFASCNHVNIISEDSPKIECIKMNPKHYSCSMLNAKQLEINGTNDSKKHKSLQSPVDWKFAMKNNNEDKKCNSIKQCKAAQDCESLNQHTLFETHRLIQKKQYSEMLMNFISPELQTVGKDFNKNVNKKHSIKEINLSDSKSKNQSLIDLVNQDDSSEVTETKFCKPWYCLNKSSQSRLECKKPTLNLNLEKDGARNESYSKSVIRNKPIEIIKINTLRDEFSNKQVIKHDFISQITNRYNKRMEECCKEAEELKKKTYILSKHNQLTREAALAEQLNRSMRFYKEVLDEKDLSTEPALPKLTAPMLEHINNAMSVGVSDDVLVQGFGLQITRKDIQTLAGLNWLNDEIINFYMNLLIVRGNCDKYPSVYAMNTFFYTKLCSSGHACLKRWTRKVDLFAKDLIVVPIHLGMHWCLAIIDFRNKSIKYYDSMGSPNYKCLQVLKQYLYEESVDKRNKTLDFVDWNFDCMTDIPQQMNGSDCGVFSCMFAEYICANKDLNFTQEEMPYFRKKMVYEILTTQLL